MRDGEELTRDHEKAKTPCGHPSPYSKLGEHNGKVLLLGTGVRTITYFHYVEEAIEKMVPFSPFTTEEFTLKTRNKDGELVTTVTRLYERKWALRRYLVPLENELAPVPLGLALPLEGIGQVFGVLTDLAVKYEKLRDLALQREPLFRFLVVCLFDLGLEFLEALAERLEQNVQIRLILLHEFCALLLEDLIREILELVRECLFRLEQQIEFLLRLLPP